MIVDFPILRALASPLVWLILITLGEEEIYLTFLFVASLFTIDETLKDKFKGTDEKSLLGLLYLSLEIWLNENWNESKST